VGISVNVNELIEVQDELAELGDRAFVMVVPALQKIEREVDFALAGFTAEGEFVDAFDL
jgi:hypothetical protein